jgi:flagellar hook assembly protein FlgD
MRNTIIEYHLPELSDVKIAVFDVMGREIDVLLDKERKEKGEHSITWDGTDKRGNRSPAGVYFVIMEAGRVQRSCKLNLLR